MTAAIVPVRPAASPGLIQLAASDVVCDLHPSDVDQRNQSVTYELVLANQAAVPISGRLYGSDKRKGERTFGELEVSAHSLGRSTFTVPLDMRNADDHVYMEVVGEGIHLLAEARTPTLARRRGPFMPGWAVWCGSTVLALAASIGFFVSAGFASPSIIALVAPRQASPGMVNVSYAIHGRAAASYRATVSDGTLLSSGSLSSQSGDIPIQVPPAAAGQTVSVVLDADGPLGHATRSAAVAIEPRAIAATPPQILALTARRETDGTQQSVLVSYSAIGNGGTVRILDGTGAVVGSAPFSHVGTTLVALPGDMASEALRAELDVTRNNAHANAAVELPAQGDGEVKAAKILANALRSAVAAGASVSEPPANGAAGPQARATSADSGAVALPGDPFYVQGHVVGGQSFDVEIRHALPHMRIELQDQMGTTLDERTVSPGDTAVTLDAPKTSIIQTFYLAGTFVKASGEETIVRSLRIFPQ